MNKSFILVVLVVLLFSQVSLAQDIDPERDLPDEITVPDDGITDILDPEPNDPAYLDPDGWTGHIDMDMAGTTSTGGTVKNNSAYSLSILSNLVYACLSIFLVYGRANLGNLL